MKAAGPLRPPGGALRSRTLALVLLTLATASGFALSAVFSPLQEAAKADLHLSDFQISLVQGLAASIPIAVLSLPLGRVVDRGNRVRLVIALSLVSVLGTAVTGLASGFGVLFIGRMLAGIGAICTVPAAISVVADLARPEVRGRLLLALSLGRYCGAALAFALGGALYGALRTRAPLAAGLPDWRAVHLIFAVGALLLVLPLLLLREPARRELADAPDAALGPAMRELWARRSFLGPLFLGQVGVVMADTAASIWASPLLGRDHHLRPDQFAGWLGLIVLVAGVLGSFAGGVLADLGQRGGRRGGVLTGAVLAAVLAVPASLFSVSASLAGFAAGLALLLATGAAAGLITAAAIAVLVPNEIRGVCLGAFVVLGGILGFGVAPTLVTIVSDHMPGRGDHLGAALALTNLGVGVLSLAAFVLALRNAPRPVLPANSPATHG